MTIDGHVHLWQLVIKQWEVRASASQGFILNTTINHISSRQECFFSHRPSLLVHQKLDFTFFPVSEPAGDGLSLTVSTQLFPFFVKLLYYQLLPRKFPAGLFFLWSCWATWLFWGTIADSPRCTRTQKLFKCGRMPPKANYSTSLLVCHPWLLGLLFTTTCLWDQSNPREILLILLRMPDVSDI